MKRGDILYPHAFTIAAIILRTHNSASIQQIHNVGRLAPGGPGPALASHHRILRHLEQKMYVRRSVENELPYGHRVQWHVTETGKQILQRSKKYYQYALQFLI